MCRQEQIKILEDSSNLTCINMLLYDHTPIHVILETKMTPSIGHLPITHFKENQDGSIKIFVHSKKADTFIYELILVYILSCIGIEKYSCRIQVFENVNDICILETFVHVVNRRFNAGLSLLSGNKGIEIVLGGKVIYKTDIF